MRIISNFHDYYDGLQTHTEPIFVRNKKVYDKVNSAEVGYNGIDMACYLLKICNNYHYVGVVENHLFYSMDDFKKFASEQKEGRYWYSLEDWPVYQPEYLDECLALYAFKYQGWQKPHKLVLQEINPTLKDWGFQSQMNIQTLFQEIEMWASNRAWPDKPLPKIDDVTLAESKGFNKYSFRKDKSV